MQKNDTRPEQLYREDLARIHIEGYGFHWQGASPAVLQWLGDVGIRVDANAEKPMVVDLGCGGGQWLAHLSDLGFQTFGVDISPTMIEVAEKKSPTSELVCGSFDTVELPICDAVTSLGEPLSYLDGEAAIKKTIDNVHKSLRPGGVFVFDVRVPSKRAVMPINHQKATDDWFCFARIVEDHLEQTIVRTITTFWRIGESDQFRRDREVHHLKTFPTSTVNRWLRDVGFTVKNKRSYGEYKLRSNQAIFVCRKD